MRLARNTFERDWIIIKKSIWKFVERAGVHEVGRVATPAWRPSRKQVDSPIVTGIPKFSIVSYTCGAVAYLFQEREGRGLENRVAGMYLCFPRETTRDERSRCLACNPNESSTRGQKRIKQHRINEAYYTAYTYNTVYRLF